MHGFDMKSRWLIPIFFVLLSLLSMPLALASNHTIGANSQGLTNSEIDAAITKAYQCLKDRIDEAPRISFDEAIFSALALGSYKNLSTVIDSEKKANEACWPKRGCTIKETAQVALAYQSMGKNTGEVKAWLLSKAKEASDLAWHIEIDIENQGAALCTLKYDSRTYSVDIDEDMKLSGTTGPCLSVSSSGYLLRIRDSCLQKTFEISCNQGFITTLVYQKEDGSGRDCLDATDKACFVSPETHSAASLGTTEERVRAQCYGVGSSCDYEGTLWASLALSKIGAEENATKTLPYLIVLADDFKRYFPEAFLYILGGEEGYYSKIIQSRKQNQFWDLTNSPYNRFYDTSVGLLALGSRSSGQTDADTTRQYLIEVQTKEGCWNNNRILDTGFILYSGWPRTGISGPGSSGSTAYCEEAGFSCEILSQCQGAGGNVLSNFACTGIGVCCSVKVPKQTCQEQSGTICSLTQECQGNVVESSNGACCVGSCIPLQNTNVCELSTDATCRTSCGSGEIATSDSCGTSGEVCCVLAEDKSYTWLWITLLIILIALVIAGIVFRDKIRFWIFKMKGKVKTSSLSKGTSGDKGSPAPIRRGPPGPPRFGPPRGILPQRPASRAVSPTGHDKEMEETLRKLREIGE